MRHYDQHQAVAKKNSIRLVMMMTFMQLLTIALAGAVFGYLCAVIGMLEYWERLDEYPFLLVMGIGAVFTMPVVGLTILGAALWKFHELKEGGKKIAECLRAEEVNEETRSPQQRQLLNIVQELAISASIPVPPVYIMYGERGINALAAGHTPADAVIVVTEGALNRLTRDQMQGVMAHEFAHILNGDMGRNMWLMAFTHGNYCLILIAQEMIEYEPVTVGNSMQGAPVMQAAGYVLWPLGLLGAFLALAFTAMIKREDEFHADATAVELTRLPNGLSEALMMIGGNQFKGLVRSSGAFEASHLFFADSGWSLTRLFDPHPPLNNRIVRLHPQWDGCYLFESDDDIGEYSGAYQEVVELVGAAAEIANPNTKRKQLIERNILPVAATLAAASTLPNSQSAPPVDGNDDETFTEAGEEGLPEWICEKPRHSVEIDTVYTELAADPRGAGLILAAIRLDQFESEQLEQIKTCLNPAVAAHVLQLLPNVAAFGEDQKITLFDRSLESIRTAPAPVRALLTQFVQQTSIPPEEETSIARWAWQRIVNRKLNPGKKPSARFGDLHPMLIETVILISSVVHTDSEMNVAAQYTYVRAAGHTELSETNLLPPEDCTIERLEYALDRLNHVAARAKRQLLVACGTCVTSNREINLEEAWIIRAICCGLHYPMPKLIPGQPVTPGA